MACDGAADDIAFRALRPSGQAVKDVRDEQPWVPWWLE